MKKDSFLLLLLLLLLLFIMSFHIAEANNDESAKTHLFPKFEKGYVILKDYTQLWAQFNYDMVEEKMLFFDSDSIVYEIDTKAVITVIIGKKTFIPVNKVFYERVEVSNNEFYIRHKTKLLSFGKESGYGTYSQTHAITGHLIATEAGRSYLYGTKEKMIGIDDSFLYIKNKNKFEKINSLNKLLKFFKSHETEIKVYSKDNKIDFKKIDHVMAIVEYAFSG